MSLHPLDRSVRAKIANGSTPVPAGMWESIETQLPPAPASSRRTLWLSALGIIALVAGIAFASQYLSRDGNQETTSAISDVENQSQTASDHTALAILDKKNQSEEIAQVSTTTEVLNEAPSEDNVPVVTSKIVDQESSEKTPTDLQSKSPSSTASSKDLTYAQTQPDETISSNATPLEADDNFNDQPSILPTRKNATFAFLPDGKGLLETEYSTAGAVTDCYAFGKTSRGTWLAEIYTGPTYSLKSMDSRDEDVSGFINGRDSTESAQISWHAGVRIGYEHSSGLTAKAGFQYSLVNELFMQVTRTSGVLIDTTFDSNGDIISIDTSIVTGELTKQTQNRYHAIDIPLIIGYRIDNGNWDFGIEAGPIFNITYQSKGDMIGADGQPFSFSDESDPNYQPVFNTAVGIGLFAGVYASMRVGESIWVFAEPNVHHRFGSVTRDDFPIDQRQTNISLSIGLRYKF